MISVLFLTTIPSPYRVAFFNELGNHIDLTVLFEKKASDERDDLWKQYEFSSFHGIVLKGISVSAGSAFCPGVLSYLKQDWDYIICTNAATVTGAYAIAYMKLRHIKYYLEGDGAFAGDGTSFKDRVKKIVLSGAEGYFSTSEKLDDYYIKYGAGKENIIRYHFSSLYNKDILSSPLSQNEKKALRSKLGASDSKTVLAVGSIINRKGFDLLMSCADGNRDVEFYFVGGEPTQEYEKMKSDLGLSNIHFVGFRNKAQLWEYYQIADVFVLPTRLDIWGLVINEAMANGLPVISTNRCGAALELIKEGKNGYIVNVDDKEALSASIRAVFERDREKMGEVSLKIIREYTIEKMAEDHLAVFSRR